MSSPHHPRSAWSEMAEARLRELLTIGGVSRDWGDDGKGGTTGRAFCRLGDGGWGGCCGWLERGSIANPGVPT
jgi:hypothetical protein